MSNQEDSTIALQASCLNKIKLIFTPGCHVLVAKETTKHGKHNYLTKCR